MVPTVILGRKPAGPDLDYGEISSGQIRATTFNVNGQHLWIHTLGARIGNHGGAATAVVAAYDPDEGRKPNGRLGYSQDISVTAGMTSWEGGAPYERPVAVADNALSNKGIRAYAGKRISLAILAKSGDLGHNMMQASRLSGVD